MSAKTVAASETGQVRNPCKPWMVTVILLLADIIAISAAFFLAFYIRERLIPAIGGIVRWDMVSLLFVLQLAIIVLLFWMNGMYPGFGRTGVTELRGIIVLVSIAYIFLGLSFFFFSKETNVSRWIFVLSWVFTVIFISVLRTVLHNKGSLRDWWGEPVALVGHPEDSNAIIRNLNKARRMGYKPIAIVDTDGNSAEDPGLVPVLKYSEPTLNMLRNKGVRLAIFSGMSFQLEERQKNVMNALSLKFPRVMYVMGQSPISSLLLETVDIEGNPALISRYNLLNPANQVLKRAVDLILCVVSLIITLPIFLLLALIIRTDSEGPVIYVQERMGKFGKPIRIYKFRTMRVGAEDELQAILAENPVMREEYAQYHKLLNDPRLTRVGKFLRKTSLDELPQFYNVIKGDMSVVGPRAYLFNEEKDMGRYAAIIHRVAPGLTGWWQVMGRHTTTFEDRLRLDAYYISNFSLWMDMYIILKTAWIIVAGKGT